MRRLDDTLFMIGWRSLGLEFLMIFDSWDDNEKLGDVMDLDIQ